MTSSERCPKIVIVGAGPVGALAGLYAAQRGYLVEIYEGRQGTALRSIWRST